jgi:hypothetical protein
MNPHAQSHEALKAMTDAASPAGSQAVADSWRDLSSGFDEAAGLFQRAMLSSEPGWSGAAAEAMRAQLARIAEWAHQTGAAYRAASQAIGSQSEAADSAKSAMPPPVPYDPAKMIKEAVTSGNVFEMGTLSFRMYAQKQKHDAAHDEAARIVAERDATFSQTAMTVPAFVPPPLLNGGHVPDGPPHPRTPRPDEGARPAPVPRAPAPGQANQAQAPRQEATPGGTVTPSPPAAPPAPATSASAAMPAGQPARNLGTVPSGTPMSGSASGLGGQPAAGFGGPPAVPAAGFGAGGVGPAGAVGFGPNGSPVVDTSPARGATGARSLAGPGGAAGAGSAHGGAAEDTERKRPEYLIEPDAEGMFGSDALTAPPVIGEE